MDECFLVLLFQNKSSFETFQMKMSLTGMKNEPVGGSHMNGFTFRLVLTQTQKATRSEMAYWVNVEKVVE